MMKHIRYFGMVLLLCNGCISVDIGDVTVEEWDFPGEATGFIHLSTEVDGEEQAGMVYVPADYDPTKKYPIIVFLHGLGESGSDGITQTTQGIGNAIRNNPERFPCIVYMPQTPVGKYWNTLESREKVPDSFHHITDGIERVLDIYSIDEDRISLTGLSMGGYGTFAYGGTYPERFSAFMPICGGGDLSVAPGLAQRPMWVFHGEDDEVIPVRKSKEMVNATRELGGSVKFTTYPGVGHNSWDQAYSVEEQAIEWLLEQHQ